MATKKLRGSIILTITAVLVMSIIFSACGMIPGKSKTLSIEETSAKEFVIDDFDAVHAMVNEDAQEYLIFGNLPISKPAADLPSELTVFLGRWEGYSYSPPVKRDRKLVLVIQEITTQGGTGFVWSGTNLQYPDMVGEIHFRVTSDEVPSIEWQFIWPDGNTEIASFTYDGDKQILRGWTQPPESNDSTGPYDLTRDQSFNVYKDYARYLETKHIQPREYQDENLQQYGKGYMLYLPDGYEADPDKSWPLMVFLHGYGDRGENLFVLPKASPFMIIREKGPLPFIIVAPLLNTSHTLFPNEYMDGVLKEILADYRVDQKRIYLTGMSMGGEATYRFALHQPDTFAAIAPLCAYIDLSTIGSMDGIKDLPVSAIHGSEDVVIPEVWGRQAADVIKKAGADVQYSVLEGYDHDVWTATYSDPQFYDWFMQYQRP